MSSNKQNLTICRAGKRHIPDIVRLLLQVCLVHHNGRPDLFKKGARKYTDSELERIIADDSKPVFVAENEDGEMVGYAFCIFQQHENDSILTPVKTLYIDDLCVDENCRGHGVGSSLYNAVLDFASQQGCYNVTLNVWACNEKAMGFYKAMGLSVQKQGMEKILAGKN